MGKTAVVTVLLVLIMIVTSCTPEPTGPAPGDTDDAEPGETEEPEPSCGDDEPDPPAVTTSEVEPPFEPVPVPDTFVGGYLEHYRELLPRDLPEEYNLLLFAFLRIDDEGGAVFTHEQSASLLKADIRARNAEGRPTLLSIGGAGGARTGLHTQGERQRLVDDLVSVIDDYRFSGIDWDLEQVPGGISADGLVAVSQALVQRYGDDFAITLAPYDRPEITETYKNVAGRLRDVLTFVGYQFYNNEEVPTVDHVLAVTEEWLSECRLEASQWALGFLHADDNLGLTTSHDRMADIYEAVAERHPDVRGTWTWAVGEKDEPLGYPFAETMSEIVDTGN